VIAPTPDKTSEVVLSSQKKEKGEGWRRRDGDTTKDKELGTKNEQKEEKRR
jgi:hypothetical protein